MLRYVSRIAAVLLLIVAGALAPAAEERPIGASGAGLSTEFGLSANGFEATHLGRAYFNGDLWEHLLDNSHIIYVPAYLTAADGDRLYLDCVVDYVVDYDTGNGIAIGTATFTGGTGRFENATGSADVLFDFNIGAFGYRYFRFLIDGSIDY